ncbi:MAG TPA: VOC family protein, partial [Terracidiphilus sp.]|nr:VOC family protein [Terracidiphilus sp.]
MKLTTYLNYGGNCADAFRFYEKELGGEIGMLMTHDQAPDQTNVKPEWAKAVLHANITIGDTVLMASDVPP